MSNYLQPVVWYDSPAQYDRRRSVHFWPTDGRGSDPDQTYGYVYVAQRDDPADTWPALHRIDWIVSYSQAVSIAEILDCTYA